MSILAAGGTSDLITLATKIQNYLCGFLERPLRCFGVRSGGLVLKCGYESISMTLGLVLLDEKHLVLKIAKALNLNIFLSLSCTHALILLLALLSVRGDK